MLLLSCIYPKLHSNDMGKVFSAVDSTSSHLHLPNYMTGMTSLAVLLILQDCPSPCVILSSIRTRFEFVWIHLRKVQLLGDSSSKPACCPWPGLRTWRSLTASYSTTLYRATRGRPSSSTARSCPTPSRSQSRDSKLSLSLSLSLPLSLSLSPSPSLRPFFFLPLSLLSISLPLSLYLSPSISPFSLFLSLSFLSLSDRFHQLLNRITVSLPRAVF